jgi:hypothetical protein
MYATSPDRYGFMIENYKKRLEKDPDNIEIKNTLDFYERCRVLDSLENPKENDLSHDLRKCEWIIDKCKSSRQYSQNLYAALCNNSFFKNGNEWFCSWRVSAGIVSNLREEGDYVDWYCSGIPAEWNSSIEGGLAGEGAIAEEIRIDLASIGWTPGRS